MQTSNRKGDLAELKAQIRAVELGYLVSIPTHHCRYDLVLDDGKKLWRVQVKYGDGKLTHAQGSVRVNLAYETRRRRYIHTYAENEVDALVVYLPKLDKLCWLPNRVFVGKKSDLPTH